MLRRASNLFLEQLATASGRLGQKNALSLEEWKDLCIQNLDAHLQMCENHILTVWTITHGERHTFIHFIIL